MYKEDIYNDASLPEHIKLQVLCFLRIHYPEGFSGTLESRDWINNPNDNSIHVVIHKDDIVISYLAVVQKELEHAGEIFKCMGFTGVLTYPAFRKQGHGHRLIEVGTQIIKDNKADIGMFHCGYHLQSFYPYYGWTAMEQAITVCGDKDNPTQSDQLLFMQFFSDKGKNAKEKFETIPIYFGEDTW